MQTDGLSSYSTWVLNQRAGGYISTDRHMVKILSKFTACTSDIICPELDCIQDFWWQSNAERTWAPTGHTIILFSFSFWHLQEVVSSSSGESWAPTWWFFFFLGGVWRVENHWFSMHTQYYQHHSYKICHLEELECSNKTSMSPVYIANKCPSVHWSQGAPYESRTWEPEIIITFLGFFLPF